MPPTRIKYLIIQHINAKYSVFIKTITVPWYFSSNVILFTTILPPTRIKYFIIQKYTHTSLLHFWYPQRASVVWMVHLKTILVKNKLVRLSSRFSFMIVRKTASLLSDKEERNMIKWRWVAHVATSNIDKIKHFPA